MSQVSSRRTRPIGEPEPTWEVAYLFPAQGTWSEEEYLSLSTNQLVEFSHGNLEVLPMPTTSHQLLVLYLYGLVLAFTTSRDLGTVLVAALPVRLWRGKFREPDVIFMLKEHAKRIGEQYWKGADLVMEVVSGEGKNRRRDLVTKRQEYARAGIPEYWIVDPQEEQITVLRLAGKRYGVHGTFARGMVATSHLLPGFTVNVTEALSQRAGPATRARAKRKPRRPSPP
jgi:Uma2 family endonuclease